MWRLVTPTAFLCGVFLSHQVVAEEADPACRIQKSGQFDLTPSVENEVIVVTGDVCQLEFINVAIETHDGRSLYEFSVHHGDFYLGTSGRTAAESFEWTIDNLANRSSGHLPRLDQLGIDYELWIDLEDYERLRETKAPVYAFKHYYAGYSHVVYDNESGEVVLALSYGT